MKWHATCVIMAGGKSSRMGEVKSMLYINGKPMIEHIINQIRPYFNQIIISSDDKNKYAFLGARIIPDKIPDQGPLMGILSCLEVSSYEINFVVACDIPVINHAFVKNMIELSDGYDAVIPVSGNKMYEPLFGIYRKSMIVSIKEILNAGKHKISDVFKRCNIKYIDISNADWYKNINTMADYKKYVQKSSLSSVL